MNKNILNSLLKYCTARIDIKNSGNGSNSIEIIENNDSEAKIYHPPWFKDKTGEGIIIESNEGVIDFRIKCITQGTLNIWLRSKYFTDINNNKFPIYIDYTNFKINNEQILKNKKLIWHDRPYLYKKEVHNNETLDIHIQWKPFDENSEIVHDTQIQEINYLKEKLFKQEQQIKSIPQLSCTTLGYSALNGKIIYRNWLGLGNPSRSLLNDFNGFCEGIWFTKYLKHKFPDEDFMINIFGVSNYHENIEYPMKGKKVLYSAEDLDYRYLEMKTCYDKYALEHVDFAMGFDLIDNSKYLRFPFWLIYHFSPEIDEEGIENKVKLWNSSEYIKTRDVVSISSHDHWLTRSIIDNDIKELVNVTYAGRWKNNTSELWNKFNNNKQEYLKLFKFNLCAENLINNAYVTEKIFDAIQCDCIPLYAGGGNYLEPKVINPNAVIRWYEDENLNLDSIECFKNIISDEKTYSEFKDQDKVLESSTKYIIKIFEELEKHFERLIYE